MNLKRIAFILTLITLAYPFAQASPSLDGFYEMKLTIGDKVFIDELHLLGESRPLDYEFSGNIIGSVSVPGVFTAPLYGTATCSHMWANECLLVFKITATENDKNFKVYYEAKIDIALQTLKGEAYLDNRTLLGSFVGFKKNER